MYSHTGVCIDTEGYITAFPPYLRLLHWRREVFSSPISSAWRDGMAMTLIDRKHPPPFTISCAVRHHFVEGSSAASGPCG